MDAAGHPASSALSFHATPAALASAGLYVVTAGDEGLAVFERSTGECVQQLPYGEGIVAAPGQHILAADNAHGSCIAIAGNRKVMVQLWHNSFESTVKSTFCTRSTSSWV